MLDVCTGDVVGGVVGSFVADEVTVGMIVDVPIGKRVFKLHSCYKKNNS